MGGRTGRVLLVPLMMTIVVVLVAVAAGFAFGALYAATAPPSDGWSDLAAVVAGLLVAAVVGTVTWVIGLLWAARRLFPRGRRAGAVWVSLGLAALSVLVAAVVAGVVGQGSTGAGPSALGLSLLLVDASVGFALWDHHLTRSAQRGRG